MTNKVSGQVELDMWEYMTEKCMVASGKATNTQTMELIYRALETKKQGNE